METETKIKLLAGLVGLAGFLFSVVQYVQVQRVNASAPYLERKLAWCEEAIETASAIATRRPAQVEDLARFEEMYWGVMGLIENAAITRAMDGFHTALANNAPDAEDVKSDPSSRKTLQGHALAIAHACRRELSHDWSSSWARER
ncbi:hypothetical protein PGB28_01620 [Primorskyibacter aestuariivivens]|uniref:hypothetical protein n=1 Tax=Primorskyibacter aestuariivivens TaxID=1888912 RepID=UPI00230065B4|nr:hypothetical protein [Primorskyibacter aestuariivivens]MDA7427140.1 hypothetical protein [Primorskyibacter aestuariivivens]